MQNKNKNLEEATEIFMHISVTSKKNKIRESRCIREKLQPTCMGARMEHKIHNLLMAKSNISSQP
jgi:hypothetical protein